MAKIDELFDLEAERKVLGACILDNGQIDKISQLLGVQDFYRPVHGQIFESVRTLNNDDQPVDLTTLSDLLRQKGILEEIGGRLYLVSLAEGVATGSNAPYHAKIVREFSVRRQLSTVGAEVSFLAKDMTYEPEAILEKANEKLYSLANLQTEPVPLGAVFAEVLERAENGFSVDYKTGYVDLDELTGLQKGQLLTVAAETSFGKTTFALDLAHRFCLSGHPVLIFSLEMSRLEIAGRYLAKAARVPYLDYSKGNLNQDQQYRLGKAFTELELHKAYPSVIDYTDIGIDELYAHTRPFFRSRKGLPGILIIDYLQLVRCPSKESRTQEVSYVTRRLKNLARQLDVLVLSLSQLSRKVDSRKARRPELADLRQSGEIEEASDHVWFIYRPDKIEGSEKKTTEIIVAKQRNGPTGQVDLVFRKEFVTFESAARENATAGV